MAEQRPGPDGDGTDPAMLLQQDIHFVLKVQSRFTQPVAPDEPPDGQQGVEQGVPVDPASLSLSLAFTPWSGQQLTTPAAAPVQLQPDTRVTESAQPQDELLTGNTAEPGGLDQVPPDQAASKVWEWATEKHFKITVDEAFVRSMAEAHGELLLDVSLAQPPPEPPAKPVKGQPPAPEPVSVAFSTLLPFQCAALLTGDTEVAAAWPDKLQPLPREFAGITDQFIISLKTLNMPQPSADQLAAAAAAQAALAKGGKPKPAAGGAKGGKPGKDAAPEPQLADLPGEPSAILTPGLASRLNPMVICPLRANALPDAPATSNLLDSRCHPVKLCMRWAPGVPNSVERPGRPGPWQQVQPADRGGPGLACRSVGFGQPVVLLAGDVPMDELFRWCREVPLCLEVHDRTIIPEPPEFPIRAKEGEADSLQGVQDEEGYVCGVARIPLLDLARGRLCVKFTAPLAPHTTIRGAASLDWGRRPGNYVSAQAVIKGWVRCAVPLHTMTGTPCSERIYTRAVFIMDYRDSELFHMLEDTIRRQNAWALGLAAPSPIAADLPDNHAAKSSADNSARNSRSSTPTSQRHMAEAEEAAALAHSTHSVVRMSAAQGVQPNVRISSAAGPLLRDGSRGILRVSDAAVNLQGLPTARAGDGCSSGGTQQPGARVVWSGHGTRDRKELRFHDFGGDDSDQDSEGSSVDKPATAVEAALDAALVALQTIKLDNRLTQALSTTKLTSEQSVDPNLDLLTGWHLVDGKERMIAVEGKADGAMKVIEAIAAWALEEAQSEDNWRKCVVLHNRTLLSSTRLWAQLGADLHIVKLHMPLTKIIADAGSYATGKVRVECISGLRRLAALRSTSWARVVNDLCLYPTPHQVHLVDKKFGGELSKADVFGVEVEEFDTDEEDGGGMGLVKDEDVRSSHSSSKKSGRSRKSMKSRKTSKNKRSRSAKYARKHPALQPLDRNNEAYLAMREEVRARRLATDWHAHNLSHLASITSVAASIRATWATWNPQRKAAKDLEEAVKMGTITLQDTLAARARTQCEPLPGTLPASQATARGWAPHPAPFKWPAPKDPKLYAVHPHAPSMFRVEQLAEPWDEVVENAAINLGTGPPGPVFVTTIKNTTGLFGQDPDFWKTVHLGGTGREQEEAELKAAEKAQWQRKLMGPPVMHTGLPIRPNKPTQTDRTAHILHGPPQKKGFAISHVPPFPLSIHTLEPWSGPAATAGTTRSKDQTRPGTLGGKDFIRHLAMEKRAVSKPGHGNMQSWTAATHDKYYQEG